MAASELTINVTAFKAKSLKLLEDLSRGRLERITVTKRGKAVAIVSPATAATTTLEQIYARMRGTVQIAPGADIMAPVVDDDWEEQMLADWDEQTR